jgi:hypothetical protein
MAEASFSHLKALDAPRHLMDREFSLDLDFLGFGTEDLSNLELASLRRRSGRWYSNSLMGRCLDRMSSHQSSCRDARG